MKTVRAMLKGGLGNQLFQYAFCRALSMRSGARLHLDAVTLFEQDEEFKRIFELDAFELSEEIKIIDKRRSFDQILEKINSLSGRLSVKKRGGVDEIKELPPWRFDKKFESYKISKSAKVNGYWQCERYFADYASKIKSELVPKQAYQSMRPLSSRIFGDKNSVAVHVRRVNYSMRLNLDYYKIAVSTILAIIPSANFWFFTDDRRFSQWIGEVGLRPDQISGVMVDRVDIPSIEDFKLMMHCSHFIVANSTFSWWAAYLGREGNGVVICPKSCVWHNPDIVRDDWIHVRACKER